MKRILFTVLIACSLLLSGITPLATTAAPDNSSKGHPEFEKYVFVHYADNFAKKGGGGNNTPQLYSYSGYHWKSNSISYWVNLANNEIADTNTLTGINASFQTWQADPVSQISFSYQGVTGVFPGLNTDVPDYQNVIGWAYLSADYPDAIAITIVWATRGRKLIVDCDTVLNTDNNFAWTQVNYIFNPNTVLLTDTPKYDVDVQNIMTHEIGHWLQLNDLYSSTGIEQTMYGFAGDRELKKRSLELGDLTGIQNVY